MPIAVISSVRDLSAMTSRRPNLVYTDDREALYPLMVAGVKPSSNSETKKSAIAVTGAETGSRPRLSAQSSHLAHRPSYALAVEARVGAAMRFAALSEKPAWSLRKVVTAAMREDGTVRPSLWCRPETTSLGDVVVLLASPPAAPEVVGTTAVLARGGLLVSSPAPPPMLSPEPWRVGVGEERRRPTFPANEGRGHPLLGHGCPALVTRTVGAVHCAGWQTGPGEECPTPGTPSELLEGEAATLSR